MTRELGVVGDLGAESTDDWPESSDPCPVCGSSVAIELIAGVRLGGAETWRRKGRCTACGQQLEQRLTDSHLPAKDMRPNGPWRRS